MTNPEKAIEWSILHELRDYHYGIAPSDDSFQINHVWIIELPHDARLRQEIKAALLRRAGLQRLNGDSHFRFTGYPEAPAANVTELAWKIE